MNIKDVELFLKIVETNSINAAAEQLHYSQSSLSYRLKCLEKEIGAPLFYRKKGNHAELTIYGKGFISIAQRWLAIWQDTQTIKFLPSNSLTVATVDSINSSLLADVYHEVTKEPNSLRLRVMTHQSPDS